MRRAYILIGLLIGCLLCGCSSNLKEGIAYLEAEQYEKAIACFDKDMEKGNDNLPEAYRGVAIAQYELGEYEKAISFFELALRHDVEKTATLYSLLAASQMRMEDYSSAMENYEKAIQMKDCSDELRQEARYQVIVICQKTGDWELAKEKVSAYVEEYPDDARMGKTAEFLKTR